MNLLSEVSHLEWDAAVEESGQGTSFFQNNIVRGLIILDVLPSLLSAGLFAYFVRPSTDLVVLHYNVYFGVDLLGVWWQAYILPLVSLLLLAAHILLARRFYLGAERIAAYLALLAAGFIGFGILIASASIAFINY